jgi:hypothetical protein
MPQAGLRPGNLISSEHHTEVQGGIMNTLEKVAEGRRVELQRQAVAAEDAVNRAWATYARALSGEGVSEQKLARVVELLQLSPQQIASDRELVQKAITAQHQVDQADRYQRDSQGTRRALKEAEEAVDVARRNHSAARCRVASLPANLRKLAELKASNPHLFGEIDLARLASELPPDGPPIANPRQRFAVSFKHATQPPPSAVAEVEPTPVAVRMQDECTVVQCEAEPAVGPSGATPKAPSRRVAEIGEVGFGA